MELCCRRIRRGIVTFQTVGAQQRRFTQPGHDRGWECQRRGESEECHHTLFLLGCDWLGRRIHGANNNNSNNEVDGDDKELTYIYIYRYMYRVWSIDRSIDCRWPPKIFFCWGLIQKVVRPSAACLRTYFVRRRWSSPHPATGTATPRCATNALVRLLPVL